MSLCKSIHDQVFIQLSESILKGQQITLEIYKARTLLKYPIGIVAQYMSLKTEMNEKYSFSCRIYMKDQLLT